MSSNSNRWLLVLLLSIFLGLLGVHRFAVGKIGTGFLYLFSYGLFGIGWIVDIVRISSGKFREKSGQVISRPEANQVKFQHSAPQLPEEKPPATPSRSGSAAREHKAFPNRLAFTSRRVSQFDSWVAVDVEWTDTTDKSSICEIGLARFDGGQLTDTFRSYVRPPAGFSVGFMELQTHGIRQELLTDAPTLAELWPTLEDFTEDLGWVLHNATNDVNRILHSFHSGGGKEVRDFDYIDSMGVARKFSWVETSSSLDALADYFSLRREFATYEGREAFSKPHGAREDARLTGLVTQKMVELVGYTNLKAFMKILEVEPGRVREGALLNGFSAQGRFKYSDTTELPSEADVLQMIVKEERQAEKAAQRRKEAEEMRQRFLQNPNWSTKTLTRGQKVCFTQLMPWGDKGQNHEEEVHQVANRLGLEVRHSLKSDLDLLVVNDPWVAESAKLRDALSRRTPIPVTTYSIFQKSNPDFPPWHYRESPEFRELVKSGIWPDPKF